MCRIAVAWEPKRCYRTDHDVMSNSPWHRRLPDTRCAAPPRPLAVLACLALLLPGALAAQLNPIGLSAVGAQRFDDEDLLFFVPDVGDHFAWALAAGDFDGNGAQDLATGIPFHSGLVGNELADTGIVVVRYGAPGGALIGGVASTVLYQGFVGSPDPPEVGDHFGKALAAGDFNGDGFDDLAVGIPQELWDGDVRYGSVHVHFGSATGLRMEGAQLLDEALAWTEVPWPRRNSGAEFGASLAVGNFDGDAFDDLAIGAPGGEIAFDPVSAGVLGGEVFVAHGGAGGLVPVVGYGISEESVGIFGDAADGERFGAAVAAGDFDADGFDDLAIGVSNEGDNGSLYVVMGSSFGLIYADSIFWAPGALGQIPEAGDRFGWSLVAADFDGDGHDDLAIGDPFEDLGANNEAVDSGQICAAYGAPAGFDLSRTDCFIQAYLFGIDQPGDQFGWALAAGDYDGDGFTDLAVGHPGEDALGFVNTGAVTVLMGAPNANLGARVGSLVAGVDGLPEGFQVHSDFGRALAAGDFGGDGFADLVVGAPWYDSLDDTDVGTEFVLYGSLFSDGFESASMGHWSGAAP